MDKKSKIFLWIFFLLIVGSIGLTYYRIVIQKNYIVEAQADCDPTTEECFVYVCDPSSEECTGDPEEDTSYYKLIKKNAGNIATCDPNDESCQPLVCEEGEKDCEEILCSEEIRTEEEITDECNDPVQYNIDNPAEEEEVACDLPAGQAGDGDEECEVEESECEEGDEECSVGETASGEEALEDDASEVEEKSEAAEQVQTPPTKATVNNLPTKIEQQ